MRKILFILSAVALFGAGCFQSSQYNDEQAAQEVRVSAPTGGAVMGETIVIYHSGKFDPDNLKVLAGTKVSFVNKSDQPFWPASGIHPTHTLCPGFDALEEIAPGETYSYIFEQAEECPFHNHIAPGEKGLIDVRSVE